MDKNKILEIDESSREKIINNINENYFVEAGAGSGKTTTLVKRMLTLVKEGKDISHISAITFTKAAANEFYDRFQKALIEESLKNDEYKEKYIYALKNIDLAFMGTIDSFCNMVMSEHPNEGLIPSNSEVIDDKTAEELYKREYANILNGDYNNEELEEKAKLFLRYDNHPESLFIETLKVVIDHRDCELVIPKYFKENIDEKYEYTIKTVRKIVNVLCDNPEFIVSSNDENRETIQDAFRQYQNTFNNNWNDNIPSILNAYKNTFGNNFFRLELDPIVEETLEEGNDYFLPHISRNKAVWMEINKEMLPEVFEEINNNKYAIALDFVDSAKKEILARLRKEGKLTFSDYLIYLRDTLKKDALNGGKLIKHIYERHKYYLIDEFQDTDPIQAEIFFYLSAQTIKPNWRDCIPYKGSLFIVGDPKQSIYRFKNADVASYLNVEKMFKQPIGEVLHLYQNFRSTNEVKDWFNKTFSDLFPDDDSDKDQAPYQNIPITSSENTIGMTGVYKYDVPFSFNSETEKDEYRVADIILKLYGTIVSETKKDENGNRKQYKHKLEWKDFMLITPSKASLANYTKVFRQKGIPYYVEGNIVFNESKALKAFADFYGAVSVPNDNRYLYSVLKSKLFKITDKELNEARNNGYHFNVLVNPKETNLSNNLKEALTILYDYALYAKTLKPSSLFDKIINSINGFKAYGNENMEYVYFALELLKNKENNKEIITHKDALDFFDKILSAKKNELERCPGLREDGDQVHLANLHKVKGLEAPVVILAHPRTKERSLIFRIERNEDGNKGYIFNIQLELDSGNSIPILSTNIFEDPFELEEKASDSAEKLRLQYVAATRAKNILIISNLATKNGTSKLNPWKELLEQSSSANLLNIEDVLLEIEPKNSSPKKLTYDSIDIVNNIIEQNNKLLKQATYNLFNPSKLIEDNDTEYEETSSISQKQAYENNGDTYSTILGTMVHRLMEMIVMSNKVIDKDRLVSSILDGYTTSEFKDFESDFKNKLETVYDTLHNGGYKQESNVPQDILSVIKNADNVYCEVPFTYLNDGNKLFDGIIDLIYEKDNKLHIIDWKTNKNSEGLDEHYKNQLNAYKEAVSKLLGKEVEDAFIYHISIK